MNPNTITLSLHHLLSFLKQQAKQTGYFIALYKNLNDEWEIVRNPINIKYLKGEFYLISPDGIITDDGGNQIVLS